MQDTMQKCTNFPVYPLFNPGKIFAVQTREKVNWRKMYHRKERFIMATVGLTAIDVAEYVIELSLEIYKNDSKWERTVKAFKQYNPEMESKEIERDSVLVDYFKLHKLLFFMQGYSLALYGVPLFNNKTRAHTCGPLISDLEDVYLTYGVFTITEELTMPNREHSSIPTVYKATINDAFCRFGLFNRDHLIDWSMNMKIWEQARENSNDNYRPLMKKVDIKEHFESFYSPAQIIGSILRCSTI